MDLAEPEEFRIFQAGDHPEDAFLLRKLQMILESDEVVTRLHQVFLTELNHGIRRAAGRGIGQANGPHRAESQSIAAPPREFFDRETRFEVAGFLEFMNRDALC